MDRNAIILGLKKRISQRYLDYILIKKRRPSADLAKDLEQATGIERRCWMWPDEFPNPLILEAMATGRRGRRANHSNPIEHPVEASA